MIGFGQSDKPKEGTYKDNYSLMRQADMYEAVAKSEGLKEVVLVAHDMGQTVGLELMARHDEGKLSFKIRHAILLDGSTMVDMVELVPLQKELLKKPDKAATEHLDFKEFAEGLKEVVLVAHDMGQTVGLELMARHDEGKMSFKIRHAILLDGSTMVDMVELVPLQKELLKKPDKAANEHLDFEKFAEGLRSSYGKGKATDEILNAQAAQVFAKDGDLVIAQILRYLDERKEFYDRWVGTLTNFRTAPLSVYWGVQDPVAVIAMADRIKLWSPTTDLYKIQESGHWPSIEVPDIIADAIIARLPLYR